ncbi:MAG: type VI secretion system baseplate subunit TssF [Bryobacterales bacterium]|nr:type VI secretion system baseplate subunit TssF [Bryobacterales bacterium]
MRLDEDFLRYYLDELTYLRNRGRGFARQYPRIAARLELSDGMPADPHVERLVESFAFLSARIQQQLDAQYPEITSALLGVLYPHLTHPVPPMTIARFEVDPARGKITTGHLIPRHTPLYAYTQDTLTCRFRTCYPVTLWPVTVLEAALEPAEKFDFISGSSRVAEVLRLRIGAARGSLRELSLNSLRFHIQGDSVHCHRLYEMLFALTDRVVLLPDSQLRPIDLDPSSLCAAGFAPDEDVLPYPAHAHPAYRLLQEYFHFPEKFLFFDLNQLSRCDSDQWFDVLFLLKRRSRDRPAFDTNTFALGCTPAVNLFPRTTEPIRVDNLQLEHRLVADQRRERTTEIHSIVSVSASSNAQEQTRRYQPFYSFCHSAGGAEPTAFWFARRVPTGRAELPGTDLYLSFLDLQFKPTKAPDQTVFAHTLCTNRSLALELSAGARLHIEEVVPAARIYCLTNPSPPAYPPLGGATAWQLVSNLSLNHLSFSAPGHSLQALKEILRLYCFSDRPSLQLQIEGIRELRSRRVVHRMGQEAWRGFCPGTEVTLVFDQEQYVGGGALMLASVLRHFLALHASVNSFTQLVARRLNREDEWKRWPPLAGYQPVS